MTSLVNLANKQISVQVRGGGAHVAIDVVGYFRAPAGGYVSSITAGTGLTGGTITGSGHNSSGHGGDPGARDRDVRGGQQHPGDRGEWNGDVRDGRWGAGGTGTVTSVGSGTGIDWRTDHHERHAVRRIPTLLAASE